MKRLTYLIFLTAHILYIVHDSTAQSLSVANGNIYFAAWFNGILMFNNGDTIGNIHSTKEGYVIGAMDTTGNTQWTRQMRAGGFNYQINCYTDGKGNIYYSGYFRDSLIIDSLHKLTDTSGYTTAFIIKVDTSGNFIWSKQSSGNDYTTASFIDLDSAGNIYISGEFGEGSLSFGMLAPMKNKSKFQDLYILKLDSAGNELWIKQIYGETNGGGSQHNIRSMAVDVAGNSYITGRFGGSWHSKLFVDGLTLQAEQDESDIYIIQWNSEGMVGWTAQVSSEYGSHFPSAITVDDSGFVYLSGTLTKDATFKPLPPVISTGQRVFIARFDTLGNALWVRQGQPLSSGGDIVTDTAGNAIALGYFGNSLVFPPLAPLSPLIDRSSYLIKLNKYGQGLCIGQNEHSLIKSVLDKEDHVYVLAFRMDYYQSNEMVIMKWNKHCEQLWETVIENDVLLGTEQKGKAGNIRLFPNPTDQFLNIEFAIPTGIPYSIQVFNLSGQLMLEEKRELEALNIQLDLRDLPEDIYLIKLRLQDKVITRRIVKL